MKQNDQTQLNERVCLPDCEHTDPHDFLSDLKWWEADTTDHFLNGTQRFSPPVYTLSYKGVGFAPLGGVHALTGQWGSGKTQTISLFIAAILGGDTGDLKCALPTDMKRNVLYVDTEMEEYYTLMVNDRVCRLLGRDEYKSYDDFCILRLRETIDPVERWKIVLQAIYELKPTVAFVDGLLDLSCDFNDNKESQKLIYQCMNAASYYGMSFWTLVHENPGTEKMVGHLGSSLGRKATDEFVVRKEKDAGRVFFTVKQSKARGKDVEPFTFIVIDDNGIGVPRMQSTPPPQGNTDQLETYKTLMREFIRPNGISKTELRNFLKNHFKEGQGKAVGRIGEMEQAKIIYRHDNGRFYLGEAHMTGNMFEQTAETDMQTTPLD